MKEISLGPFRSDQKHFNNIGISLVDLETSGSSGILILIEKYKARQVNRADNLTETFTVIYNILTHEYQDLIFSSSPVWLQFN